MEGLKELVAASFARYGIECPAGDSQFVWGRAPSPVQACSHSNSEFAVAQAIRPPEPTLTTALPEHNYKKGSSQEICP
jgi:hypothetical protein